MKRDEVPVVPRCDQRWSDLEGTGATRHCEVCDTPVTNLSPLPRRRALEVLAAGPQCIAYRYRPDGSIVFSEPTRRRSPTLAAGAALVVAACASEASPPLVKTPAERETTVVDPDLERACDRLLGAERRAEYRRELVEEHAVPTLDCEMMRQLYALGGYGVSIPEECLEDDGESP